MHLFHVTLIFLCVKPLVEYNSVVWSPYTIQDIETTERVERRFTKNIPGLRKSSVHAFDRQTDVRTEYDSKTVRMHSQSSHGNKTVDKSC